METKPEWVKEFPWLTRLRDISPVSEVSDFLWPRWREDHEQWWLYRVTPARLLEKERIAQFAKHWSELPQAEQMGRRRYVTDYQFWMWHTHRLEAVPFWILQGSQFVVGGTPFSFTDYERKMMEAEGYEGAEPIPPGMFPNVPFDERVVAAIVKRDKLLKFGGSLEAMKKANSSDAIKAQEQIAEQEYRKRYLEYHNETMKPQAAFWGWFAKKEAAHLPDAPVGLADTLTSWKDKYIETGILDGAGVPISRKVQVTVR